MSIHNDIVAAWSYRRRTARTTHICRLCGGIIHIGVPYFNLTFSDTVTPTSEKLSCKSEHIDCSAPWYVPVDHSPTTALTRGHIPKKGVPATSQRYEIASQSKYGGSVFWQAPDYVHAVLQQQSPTTAAAARNEMANVYSAISDCLVSCLGDKQKMHELGNLLAEMQQLTGFEPDLSRIENATRTKATE